LATSERNTIFTVSTLLYSHCPPPAAARAGDRPVRELGTVPRKA
jgi:hypothetical protein